MFAHSAFFSGEKEAIKCIIPDVIIDQGYCTDSLQCDDTILSIAGDNHIIIVEIFQMNEISD